MNPMHPLTEAVIAGNRDAIGDLVRECIDDGENAVDIVDRHLVPGMNIVGERFRDNIIFVPEMLLSARAMKEALRILEPMLAASNVQPLYRAVLGSVEGDLHDIGKNLVSMVWKSSRIEVIDLGVNVKPAKFVEAVRQHQPHLVGLSALLTTTMPAMHLTVKAIREAGMPVRIMVGGAPVTMDFAVKIGADGYAESAGHAVEAAVTLLSKSNAD